VEVDAPCEAVFDLIHDYDRRLSWDSMLSEARLLAGASVAGVGVRSRCVGTWRSGFLAMETEYVQFVRGRVSAVKLTNHPPFFREFAATIQHEALGPRSSRVTYIYSFRARPSFLEPIMNAWIAREVQSRLDSLRVYLSGREPRVLKASFRWKH
jgi:hypothetical protein